MCECSHAYTIPRGKMLFCLNCKKFVELAELPEEQNLVMPPRIYELTPRLWEKMAPWPNIPCGLAQKHGWYVSYLNSHPYLVMPVSKNGKAVYYSARNLDDAPKEYKYLYPKGVKKLYWTSSDALADDPIIICEGVADAVYSSLIGSSIALLGSYYNGSLDSILSGRHVALCLDGDSAGILAAMTIKQNLEKVTKSCKIVILPGTKDPTDFKIDKLMELIYN